MPAFVELPTSFVNVQAVESVSDDGREIYTVDGARAAHRNAAMTILQIVPAQGEWEVVEVGESLDGDPEIVTEPVLAWALTLSGVLMPITPLVRNAQWSDMPAIRRKDNPQIYGPYGTFADEVDFLSSAQ